MSSADREVLDEIRDEVRELRSEMAPTVRRMAKLLDGNGQPALPVRIDRLERRATRGDRAWWATFSAAIAALISSLGALAHRFME